MKLLMKMLGAALTAFIILEFFAFWYYNQPVHIDSVTQSTDYVWEENKFYSRGTEGFAGGVTDKNGFNNILDFDINDIDILLMGSSHMEAYQVFQNQTTAHYLKELSGKNVYNIGASLHTPIVCLNNLENAVSEFSPEEYVVIEAVSIPSHTDVKRLLNNSIERIPSATGYKSILQRSKYLRLIYMQLLLLDSADDNKISKINQFDADAYKQDIDLMLKQKLKAINDNNLTLIYAYHSHILFDKNGKILSPERNEEYYIFKKVCEDNGVIFTDTYDNFKRLYEDKNILPYGFSNSAPGKGHLNKTGHFEYAKTINEAILGLEKAK